MFVVVFVVSCCPFFLSSRNRANSSCADDRLSADERKVLPPSPPLLLLLLALVRFFFICSRNLSKSFSSSDLCLSSTDVPDLVMERRRRAATPSRLFRRTSDHGADDFAAMRSLALVRFGLLLLLVCC